MINDLQTSACKTYKYVDDTTILHTGTDPRSDALQGAASEIAQWCQINDMKINTSKTKELLFSFSKQPSVALPAVHLENQIIERTPSAKLLGIYITDDLKWNTHINHITKKASQRLYMLSTLKKAGVPQADLLTIYTAKIRSVVEYGCECWHPGLTDYLNKQIEMIQKRALKIIYGMQIHYTDALTINK